METLGQYGFYIWAAFGVVVFGLVFLGISSRMKVTQLSKEFEQLKSTQGDRRGRRVPEIDKSDKGNVNDS